MTDLEALSVEMYETRIRTSESFQTNIFLDDELRLKIISFRQQLEIILDLNSLV
jgi:hypothetical protein